MANVIRFAACLFLAAALSACSPAEPATVLQPEPEQEIHLSSLIAETAVPAVVAVQEVVEKIAPEPAQEVEKVDPAFPIAMKVIIRWEVTGKATYERKYQGVIWPGGASGPTWGLGYDGGHNTRKRIGGDWRQHPQVDLLETTSGITGQAAKQRIPEWKAARTPYSMAEQVFIAASLPEYNAAARRALGSKYEKLSPSARGGLISLGYNRGWAMTGDRRREMRVIRDECVPRESNQCIADALKGMCRLWEGTPNGTGLCSRRKDEARIVLQ